MITKGHNVIKQLIKLIGDDPKREGLIDTPDRVLRSYAELFSGYTWDEIEIKKMLTKTFSETNNYDNLIISKHIDFTSFCEHHLLPFTGVCHIGYIPKKEVVGLSKLPRLVDIYAHRLQIQERLTAQIAETLMKFSNGVGVVIEATHFCVSKRGVKKDNSTVITSAMLGDFRKDSTLRNEFLGLIK